MSMTAAVSSVLRQYATFSGRARRSEFWWWYLATFIVAMIFAAAAWFWGTGAGEVLIRVTYAAFGLAVLVPTIAVSFRRLHDSDKSGWWLLLWLLPAIGTIAVWVLMALPGTAGPNRYGPAPR